MKTTCKFQKERIPMTRKTLRRLFELQAELEHANHEDHEFDQDFKRIIESIDDLFEKIMDE